MKRLILVVLVVLVAAGPAQAGSLHGGVAKGAKATAKAAYKSVKAAVKYLHL